jgi:diguanylate cyclase (GGDEF)-like protein/PAS domain S-box-containing protein
VQLSKKTKKMHIASVSHQASNAISQRNDTLTWSLLDALQDIAVISISDVGEVTYANSFARQILQLLGNRTLPDNALPIILSQHIKEALVSQQLEFTLQYAFESELRNLQAYVTLHENPENHTQQVLLYMYDVSQHVQTENKLRQTERLLQTIIDASPDYICIKDGNNRWVKANQKLLSLYQINALNYQNHTNKELASDLHPVFKAAFQHADISDERTWHTQKPYHNEEVISLPQGIEKTLEVTKIANFQHESLRENLVMYARDVSEHKFIENQLQNRSAILDALISCDWLLHTSDSWHSVAKAVLQQACLAFRFTRAVILKNLDDNLHHHQYAKAMYEWSTPGFSQTSRKFESINFNDDNLTRWKVLLASGHPVYSEITDLPKEEYQILKQHDAVCIVIIPIFLENKWWGNIVIERCFDSDKTSSQELGSLMAIGRSLSVAIQRERARTNLNLAKIAFDSASEGIMIVDTNGNIIGVNKGFTEITGYSEAEVLGSTPTIFQLGKHALWQCLSSEGKWSGEITSQRKNGDQYHERLTITVVKNIERKITNYVGVFSDISEIKQSQNKLYELVNHDPLTGLPNRRLINELFEHAIKRAQRDEHKIATLFVDLDRFKAINDSLGHTIGDKLLLEVSKRIKHAIRESDVVGRLGGDEFLVIMDNLHNPEDASIKAKNILSALHSEFLIEGKELYISASIGIALFPEDGKDFDSIIKASDIAMYQVKNNGKNNYCFYSNSFSTEVVERFNLENQLRRALERNQFEVYYQPQVSLITNEVIGAEALIRWNHPEFGIVSPEKFIPLAEETGIILQIGEWVLTQAAMYAKQWVKKGSSLQKIAVNVSGIQIIKSNFADTVYGVLVTTGCNPSTLEIEITESTVMQNTEHVIDTFSRIKSMGVSLAIDDFGTGYSSLSSLKRLPLNKLKIDRSFVSDLPHDQDNVAIAKAIYAMAESLGFTVVAEGIETIEQETFLKEIGCQEAQGYLYGKPISAAAFAKLIEKKEGKTNEH